MTFGKLQAIAPDPAMAAGYSLLVAAGFSEEAQIPATLPEQSTPARWQAGVEWAPEQISGGGIGAIGCLGNTPDGVDIDDTNPAVNQAVPILLSATDRCGTFSSDSRGRDGRARRELLAVQSQFIAHELQMGTIRTAESLPNVALVDGTTVASTLAPLEALAAAEQVAGAQYGGRRAMFHVAPQLLTELAATLALTFSGQKWLTPMGNVIAADGGYDQVGGHHWLYVTLMPTIRLGDINFFPTHTQATDRSVNDVVITAQRLALVTFDSTMHTDADRVYKIGTNLTPSNFGS